MPDSTSSEAPNQTPPARLAYASPGTTRTCPPAANLLIATGVALCIVFMVFAFMLPQMGRAREPANRIKCTSNMRQIGQLIQMYANDHGGQYPADLAGLLDEDLTPSVLVCPSSDDEPAAGPTTQAVVADLARPHHLSYVYLGKGLSSQTATADMVILYEPLSNHANHGINILLGDGTTAWIAAAQAQRLVRQANGGVRPIRFRPATQAVRP